EHGFTSIPRGMYWAIVTMATVGFGDIVPGTPLGQIITSVIVLIGYGIIAVPTGIFGAHLIQSGLDKRESRRRDRADSCPRCGEREHLAEARYCHCCGERFPAESEP
ncbi:potassium channel family protein, partial [Dokdonella sp.]|uniref:potassium channel family protein n=1 Tax=Dokdonella sp. TaxID=2291710 RepID=UPI003C541184